MERNENINQSKSYSIDNLAIEACEINEIRDAISAAGNKLEAIQSVRELLPKFVPGISELPQPEHAGASNNFLVAKQIVELLFET